jgi:hypothetical protein
MPAGRAHLRRYQAWLEGCRGSGWLAMPLDEARLGGMASDSSTARQASGSHGLSSLSLGTWRRSARWRTEAERFELLTGALWIGGRTRQLVPAREAERADAVVLA